MEASSLNLERREPNVSILMPSSSALFTTSFILLLLFTGMKYSSISIDANHSVSRPYRFKHEASAAYWDERSPGSEFAGLKLLQTLHGQSILVTLSGNKSVMCAKDELESNALLLSYT